MPAQYLPLSTRNEIADQVNKMEEAKNHPDAWKRIGDKQKFAQRIEGEKARLASLTPPDTTGEEKDKLKARLGQLQAAMVSGSSSVAAMPSEMDMEKCPAGAVGRHTEWESFWKTHTLDAGGNPIRVNPRNPSDPKAAIWEIKDLRRTLFKEREEHDPDVGSIEMFRPKNERGLGAPSLIDHEKLSYQAMPQRLSYEQYMALFPDYQPPAHAAFLYQGGAQPTSGSSKDAVPFSAVQPAAEQPGKYLTCQATTKKGSKCNRPSVSKNKPWCVAAGHKDQFVPPKPQADDEEV